MRKSLAIIGLAVAVFILLGGFAGELFLTHSFSDTSSPTVMPSLTLSPNLSPSASGASPTQVGPQHYTYEILNTYPHDPNAFTEGLTYDGGYIYESTGSLYEQSTLRRVDLVSGNVLSSITLPEQYFGEGLAIVNNEIFQLTYTSRICFVYDKASLALIRNFTYSFTSQSQGWGLTYDGSNLIMSDGTDNLYFVNAITFQCVGIVQVRDGTNPVENINELEYINGSVYANIFTQRLVAIINPETGQVTGWIDLSGLKGTSGSDPEAVLNGIAYDPNGNRLFVTGKDWPYLYEIKLVPSVT